MIWYFKSNQKQNNRNRKELKERERRKLPGAHLPGPARPSPSPLPLPCRLPLPVGRGEAWRAPESPRPPPASSWEPRAFYQRHRDARRPCPLSLTRCSPSLPLALSLAQPERSSSPPPAVAAPRASPSTSRRAQ